MTETAPKYADTTPEALCCPFCGSADLASNTWGIGDEDSERLGIAEDELGEAWAWECNNCLAGAPMVSWNRRPDPWRYPPDMPEERQRILHTYRTADGRESAAITGVYHEGWEDYLHPIVRWMPVPEVSER